MVDRLAELRSLKSEIRIAVAGVGSIGNGLVFQSTLTPGLRSVAIADTQIERAIHCAEWLDFDYDIVYDLGSMQDTIDRGRLAVCEEGKLLAQCESVDVFVEATSSILAGGEHALIALEHGQHVVTMNYEADLMFGPLLSSEARKLGLVYSGCDGDQPAVVKRVINDLCFWGFDLVMAGNIKGYLDRYANPTSIIPEADKRNLDYQMCTSYTDGTKLCVEMAVVANALGLRTAVPGMQGPRCVHVRDVFQFFDFDSLWRDRQGVVDYVLGAQPTGGVFAVGYTEQEFQQFTLDWFPPKMGPGPFYLFYRPYHLGHIEAMAAIADAVLEGIAVIQPSAGFQTNVYAYAKKDLRPGTTLDGVGGYDCYGLIENCAAQGQQPGLPICLAGDVVLNRAVPKDSKILLSDISWDPGRRDFVLHSQATELASAGPVSVDGNPQGGGGPA
jgi:predicted homoserine dehydrogenase-like protein